MSSELDLLKQIAIGQGYRFETDWRGVERMYAPDGTLVITAGSFIPEAPPPANLPNDVTLRADGTYSRPVTEMHPETGETRTVHALVCEDCWEAIPSYLDFPNGLTSPESDGDAGGNFAKTRIEAIGSEGKMGMAHLPKVVCLPCYHLAFARVYPGAALPELRDLIRVTRAAIPSPVPDVYIEAPKGAAV